MSVLPNVAKLLGYFGFFLLVPAPTGGATLGPPFSLPATFQSAAEDGATRHWCVHDNTLTLRADRTYVERVIIYGREQYEGSGRWQFDALRQRLALSTSIPDKPEYYRITDATSVERLDLPGNVSNLGCVIRLARASKIAEFSGSMKPVTLSSDIWTLEGLGETNLRFSAGAKPPTLTFDERSRRFTLSIASNRLSGGYARSGATLKLAPFAIRSMARLQPSDVLNARLQSALERTTTFNICCSTLELRDAKSLLATFRTTR